MSPQTSTRDPRSIVTPDAFELSKELLGLRLASPRRRLAAILVDLLVIGLITALTQSFALVLGVVAAALFIRAGFKRTAVRSSVFDRAMRGSVGCLGVLIAIVTVALWASFGPGGRGDDPITITIDGEGVRTALLGSPPQPATPDAAAAGSGTAPENVEPRDVIGVADEVSLYSTEEALEAYAALLRSGRDGEMDVVRREALESRLVREVAADTLLALEMSLASLRQDVAELEEDLSETEAELDELEEGGGALGWLRSIIDELGFGFGWASLYFTVLTTWWKGQTIGKRVARIRVMRLDGDPITWWVAFERAGGYAAGFATGLLGFAQVFWDANRQAIHDRIVGTVVVMDGVPKVIDWESAL
ncbi:MAG: RDD family protein [Gemmatimonadota bacterium]